MKPNSEGMRKLGSYIKNIYRIKIARPGKSPKAFRLEEGGSSLENDRHLDQMLRKIVHEDGFNPEADNELQKMLEMRVANKSNSSLAKNSIAETLFPILSLKHIEVKMALITLAIVLTIGLGPGTNHSVNRNLNPFILADTLIDSSNLHIPMHDSAIGR